MELETVSIIMAAYNAGATVARAVDSVLRQTYPRWELLVVNDGSSDNTAQIVRDYCARDPRIRLIDLPQNGGVSLARLTAARQAAGEWLAILDSDDAWQPEKLEKQFLLQEKTGASLLFTGSSFMDAAGNPLAWQMAVPTRITYSTALNQNLISNSSALVRRSLYLAHYAQGDAMHEDFATWLSILKTGLTAYGVNEPLLIYRLSPSSRSGNKLRAARMNWNTYRYIGLSLPQAAYRMVRYTLNGLKKYRHLL